VEKLKAVILAGGFGTRISEETQLKPKPLIEIGEMPLLWHIMKIYSSYGINDFVICCGYKGFMIKEYFSNYALHRSDLTIDLEKNNIKIHSSEVEPWKITLVDTGLNTMTGGRLKKVKEHLDDETFCFTYGDGLSDIDLRKLIDFHKEQKTLATVTGVRPPGRFGAMSISENKVLKFQEKPEGDGDWINGGFFVLEPQVLDYIQNENTVWEREPLEKLSNEKQLSAYLHSGFWQPVDTIREKNILEELWKNNSAPWKKW
jgi:glucose-1-phosphate cytidylyltransferase